MNDELLEKLTEYENINDNLRNQLKEINGEEEEARHSFMKKISSLESEIASSKEEAEHYQQQQVELLEQIDKLKQRNQKLENLNKKLSEDEKANEGQIQKLEEKNYQLTHQLEEITKKNENLQRDLEKSANNENDPEMLEALTDEVAVLRQEKEIFLLQIDTLTIEIEEAKDIIKELTKSFQDNGSVRFFFFQFIKFTFKFKFKFY